MDLTLIMTEDCNLRCRYCYQKDFIRTEMPLEIAMSALNSAVSRSSERLSLTFFGGEPLLRAERLFEVLRYARTLERRSGIPITAKVPTNGLLLDDAIIEEAGRWGLFVSLSFDGIRQAQDAGRVRPDGASSYEAALAALRRLVAARRPFGVYSVVTPQNARWFAQSRQFLWDEGARIFVSALDYTARWDAASIDALRKQYAVIAQFYRQLLRQREHFHFEPFDSRISQHTRPKDWQRCCPGISQVTVGPDGTLYGCVEYFYRRLHPLGSAASWLDAPSVRAMASERGGLPEECSGCGVRERCNNNCACVNLRTTGKANQPPESLCLTEQQTLFIIDAVAAALYTEKTPEFLLRQYSASFNMLSSVEKLIESLEAEHEPAIARKA